MNYYDVAIHWTSGVATYNWCASTAKDAENAVRDIVRVRKDIAITAQKIPFVE